MYDSRGRFSAAATSRPTSPNACVEERRAPRRCDSNVQKQWTTRTLNPPRRNGPSRRLSSPVLGQVAAQPRDVVTAVVVDDEQPTARSQDAGRLAPLVVGQATERRPQADDDVRRRVGRVDARRSVRLRERDPRAELGELSGTDPVGAIEQQDVASPDRTQRLERPRDLRLDIEDTGQALGEPVPEVDR